MIKTSVLHKNVLTDVTLITEEIEGIEGSKKVVNAKVVPGYTANQQTKTVTFTSGMSTVDFPYTEAVGG